MNTIVIKASPQVREQMRQRYTAFQKPSSNPYIQFFFKVKGVVISVYSSGKVVFQGEQALQYAQDWGYQVEEVDLVAAGQEMPLIGSDEVGNGSYFGGLAVVASFVTPKDHAFLRSLGVDDSKRLSDDKIRAIAPQLQQAIPHQPLLLSPAKYNEVIEQGYNAVSVKVALHNQAIFLLLQKGVEPQKIVIDAFTSEKNYNRYLTKERHHFSNPITLEQKAEGRYLAVAVSSIIARSMFLENLTQLGQPYQTTLPSGAGSVADTVASQLLQRYGMDSLRQTAKLHFANTEKAQQRLI